MFYEDLFDIAEEYDSNIPSRYKPALGSLHELKEEKKFYKIYSALLECHAIVKDEKIYEHELSDISSVKPREKILKIFKSDDIHWFDIKSFMEAKIRNHSLVLKSTSGQEIEFIPTLLRSMINDGRIDR